MIAAPLRLGTRGSPLALAQATLVERTLAAAHPGLVVERIVIRTTGDRAPQTGSLETGGPMPGKGVFVKEIQEALLAQVVDVAVHSLKDLPVEPVPGLTLAAVLPREDVRDAFCSRDGRTLDELEPGARVATGSLRRETQLRRAYPHFAFVPIRGNVDTRLRKVREGQAEGTILARAGLVRLGLEAAVTELIPAAVCLPAPGQGAIGCEVRSDDRVTGDVIRCLDHPATMTAVVAERAFLRRLGGGCRTPIAAWGQPEPKGTITLHGFVGNPRGPEFLASSVTGPATGAEALGTRLAERFLAEGAAAFLTE
ncbi:MAG: hydroxymethylbilane synthase [Candidatus Coatesbacteria bacterium]